MENINSTASYLHKKFKKQLSIEPRTNERNESKSGIVESREEKIQKDNKEIVPNESTNQNNNIQLTSRNLLKSSISSSAVEEKSSNIGISKNWNEQHQQIERKNHLNTNHTTTSSILDSKKNEDPTSNIIKDHDDEKNDLQIQQDKIQQPSSCGGKYVCPYCNLVCSKPSVLQKHIRAHTNERPYPCNSCGFSFKTRSNLYKHCRSRTHANRVMGNKVQELNNEEEPTHNDQEEIRSSKPYKPRFHSKQFFKENEENKEEKNLLSDHINDIISKNNSIVNSSNDPYLLKKRQDVIDNDSRNSIADLFCLNDEPLNLTKNRKRCMSEVVEPVVQKSLIKELLLKNLNSDMQCPHCKMIFQTVTELELHKLRSCKGFVKPGAKYVRSSSVNVASILTQNKNAFDDIPHLQNTVFPLKSPGPFLGKTRLVESDKNKSFSFDDGLPVAAFPSVSPSERFLLSPLSIERERKAPVKLFGGEVKITHTSGETKSFKIDNTEESGLEYSGKVSENRVVKSSLQSGGTVLTNKANYTKEERNQQDVIRVYESSAGIDLATIKLTPQMESMTIPDKYTNIMDFSQKAVKLLTPNLKQPNLAVPGVPVPKYSLNETLPQKVFQPKVVASQTNLYNPMKLLVNGKVIRYVPGIPGPVAAEEPLDMAYNSPIITVRQKPEAPRIDTQLEIKTDFGYNKPNDLKSPRCEKSPEKFEGKKFARPNSLALKPTTASLKQHHGLTPTMFNQILISPDTPRVAKKYVQQFLHGNYFSYLGLKSSTKPVYCTLNKTQPFYVPHFKKLSMYSEWRQQDTKTEKLFVSGYDSRQRHSRYTMAGKTTADLVVHSSYKFVLSETSSNGSGDKNDEQQKTNTIMGGYECNEDYTYVRGRGRGRYVCHQCGIRCKKPSMLKKHIRTHSNDRPYTCNHCNFSFKTKGNLTKHMKSKAHTKNYAASGSGSSTQHSGTQSSESDTEDSGMDSSDESTRREEHEAAYGLLSLAQKTSQNLRESTSPLSINNEPSPHNILNTEEIVHVSKSNYVKNKILDDKSSINFKVTLPTTTLSSDEETHNMNEFLGKTTINRPLTYPYTSILSEHSVGETETDKEKNIRQFHVIQKYAPPPQQSPQSNPRVMRESPKSDSETNCVNSVIKEQRTRVTSVVETPILKINDSVWSDTQQQQHVTDLRKRKLSYENDYDKLKQIKTDEVMDLSMTTEKNQELNNIKNSKKNDEIIIKSNGFILQPEININYIIKENHLNGETGKIYKSVEYDNSAMETLADIATKQVKLEKNTLAKSVASEFLKIATKNESSDVVRDVNFSRVSNQDVNDLIVRPEGNKSCHICAKSFSKAPQLRLHMNIHYLERPFRCHSCSVSFRTKGHLQKHERSASHHNKLSSSPALSSSEPRPFKCIDCNIAFRIHGHLAKHLRSKMHIMKLECLAKIPFGLYAELERSNSLLTEINTADGDQCLESLKTLAKKVFINDPNKLNQLNTETTDS